MLIALTRQLSPNIGDCSLTHLSREPIDVDRARAQHQTYESQLVALGCQVQRVAPAPELPDGVFVEDTAVVLDELAIITRPGAASRRPEVRSVANVLQLHRELHYITPPATLDGGDVLQVGRRVYVGRSSRTNEEGFRQMSTLLSPRGYRVEAVPVDGCLHLKSAVTAVAQNTLLINPAWVDAGRFAGIDLIEVHPAEAFGANALWLGEVVVYSAPYPRTRQILADHGICVCTVDLSELAKAEGGVTCCSLVFSPAGPSTGRQVMASHGRLEIDGEVML